MKGHEWVLRQPQQDPKHPAGHAAARHVFRCIYKVDPEHNAEHISVFTRLTLSKRCTSNQVGFILLLEFRKIASSCIRLESVCCPSHLQDEQEKEVCVGYFLELLKQVDRQKGDDAVLGRHDAVVLEKDEGGGKRR